MNLKQKFDRLQYADVMQNHVSSPQTSIQLKRVHEACKQGPLLFDVADALAKYIGDSIVAVEKPLVMIDGYDWTEETLALVMKQYIVSLIARFIDGGTESRDDLRSASIDALAEFLANQTDIAFHHGA